MRIDSSTSLRLALITSALMSADQNAAVEKLRAMESERKAHEDERPRPRELKTRKNSMRNMGCPCRSGKKFKKCCWSKFE